MNAGERSIIPIIEANYEKFTDTEKIVADFFINNKKDFNISSHNLSKKLSVSEAALSRFAQKCGYTGYREFSFEYKKSRKIQESITDEEALFVINTYQNLLNKIYDLIDAKKIAKTSAIIKKSKNTYICGRGSSGLAAEEMSSRFRCLGVNTFSIRDNENMKIQSVFLTEKDCVIGISLSGMKSEVLYILQKGYKQGAKTVLITENNKDEYKDYCNEVILVPSLEKLNQGNLISPQFPILLIIDLIYANFINTDKKYFSELQAKVQESLTE